jgi:hypothetical protein
MVSFPKEEGRVPHRHRISLLFFKVRVLPGQKLGRSSLRFIDLCLPETIGKDMMGT